MEVNIKLNGAELAKLASNGVLFKILEENTFGETDPQTGQLKGQISLDTTNPSEPVMEIPVTKEEVTVTETAPTTERTYTVEDLQTGAMELMDKGMQKDLMDMLAKFGTNALPQIDPSRFGEVALELRKMGAQI